MNDFTVSITPEASKEFIELLEDQCSSPNTHGLRFGVSGSGCSGLNYLMLIEDLENINDSDCVVESNGIKIIIDDISVKYVNGSVIEWESVAFGGGFKINNPNSIGGCGCGKSFSVEGKEPPEGSCSNCSI